MTDTSDITLALSNMELDETEPKNTPNPGNINLGTDRFDAINMLNLDVSLETTEVALEIELLIFTDAKKGDHNAEEVELLSFEDFITQTNTSVPTTKVKVHDPFKDIGITKVNMLDSLATIKEETVMSDISADLFP